MIQQILMVWLVLTSIAFASDRDERPDKHGIYRISDPSERYTGTAFVVKSGKDKTILATAGHVICADDQMNTIYSAGYEYPLRRDDRTLVGKVKVLMVAKEADIALLEGAFPVEVEVMPINTEPVPTPQRGCLPPRVPASVLGFGGGKWTETVGFLSFVSGSDIRADIIAIGGQSGGPVVSDGKVVGVCAGGDKWYFEDQEKKSNPFTWPLRAGRGSRLKEMIDSLQK